LAADSFRIIGNTARVSGTVQGGSGIDSIVGPNQVNTWNITGRGELLVSSTQFFGIENITGGTSNDLFVMESLLSSITGTIAGGSGVDTLSWASWGTPIQVNLATLQATHVGRFSSIEQVVGGTGSDLIVGPNTTTTWQIQGPNQGLAGRLQFSNFESAQGGSGNDSFRFIGASAAVTNGINGGDGLDSLTGPDLATSWHILGLGSGSLGATTFGGVENLTGGTSDDVFEVSPTGSITGALSGGTGVNTLSYANWSSDVIVNLSVATSGNATAIGGIASRIQIVLGGEGNDSLIGSLSLSTLLVGNGGNDLLQGGSGRDLLFGGSGSDQLIGASGEDLLIAGITNHDSDLSSLLLLRAEWTSTRTFASRVANIKGTGTGTRLNGNTFLDAFTVFADLDTDQLTGGLNNDWFWCNENEVTDLISTDLRDNG
jgi:Ca2+-binding RTX toxin-like protein